MKIRCLILTLIVTVILAACSDNVADRKSESALPALSLAPLKNDKAIVYQVFTRLFGNQNQTNKPWGTLEENGVGKFNDFTHEALQGIKELGVTHIWVYRCASSCVSQ